MEDTRHSPQTSSTPAKNNAAVAIGAVVAAVAVGALAYQGLMAKKTPAQPEAMPATGTETASPMVAKNYKDGTYDVRGNYTSPAGPEEIIVNLTLKNNIVTDVTMEPTATHQFSQKWQGVFHDNFKDLVIGKDINALKLDKVSGSSLTPKGFNDAVEKIKAQAAS